MKKIFIFIFTLVFICFVSIEINTKASTLETNDLITIQGAQIRTSGNVGIRFVGNVDSNFSEEVAAYGICIAFGHATTDNLYLGQTINEKNVLAAQVSNVDESNCFYITLIEIPESMYNQKVTARSYVKTTSGEYIYSPSVVIRSFYKTVQAVYEAGSESELIKQLYDSIPEYTFNFEPDFKFNVSSYNKITNDVVNGYDMAILSKDLETSRQIMNVYWNSFAIAETETENVYKVVYTLPEGVKTSMIPAEIEYDYVIGGHYNCLDNDGFKTVRRISELTNATYYYVYIDLPDTASEVELEIILEDDVELFNNNAIYLDKEDELPSLSKAHYTFNGWCTDEELSSDVFDKHAGASNYYPKFTPNTYTITYHLNGGTCSANLVDEYTVESGIISLPTSEQMTKDGYVFAGWYRTSALNSTEVSSPLRQQITSINPYYGNNIDVYAKWDAAAASIQLTEADSKALEAKEATLVVNSSLSKLTEGDLVAVGNMPYTYGTNAFATITEALAVAKTGSNIYVFAGTYAESLTISTANVTIYGPNYGVDGAGSRNEEAIISDELAVSANGFTLNGIKFTGTQIYATKAIQGLAILYVNLESKGALIMTSGGRHAVLGSNYTVSDLVVKYSKFYVPYAEDGKNGLAFYGVVTNADVQYNYFVNKMTASALNEAVLLQKISGKVYVSNNKIDWTTNNYSIFLGSGSNSASVIDVNDNIIKGNGASYHTSGIAVRYIPASTTVNIVGNKIYHMGGNTFNFANSVSGSKVKILFNYFDTKTSFKLSSKGSATITTNNNCYAGGITTVTGGHNPSLTSEITYDSLTALETAYAAYKNQ